MGKNQDQYLKTHLASDSEVAFSTFYNLYWDSLFKYVHRILSDEDETADVVQESFVAFWERRHKLEDIDSLKAYLFVIARNKAFKQLKIKLSNLDFKEKFVAFYVDANDLTVQQMEAKDLSSIIDIEVAKMPAKMKEIFLLSRKENLSYKEIAEKLNISDLTVKKQINNALKIIRKALDQKYNHLTFLLVIEFNSNYVSGFHVVDIIL